MITTDSLRFFNNLNWWFLHYDFFSKNQNRGVSDFWNIKKPWTKYLPNSGSDPGEPSSSTSAVNNKRYPFQFRFLFILQPIFAIWLNHKFAGFLDHWFQCTFLLEIMSLQSSFKSSTSIHIFARNHKFAEFLDHWLQCKFLLWNHKFAELLDHWLQCTIFLSGLCWIQILCELCCHVHRHGYLANGHLMQTNDGHHPEQTSTNS